MIKLIGTVPVVLLFFIAILVGSAEVQAGPVGGDSKPIFLAQSRGAGPSAPAPTGVEPGKSEPKDEEKATDEEKTPQPQTPGRRRPRPNPNPLPPPPPPPPSPSK